MKRFIFIAFLCSVAAITGTRLFADPPDEPLKTPQEVSKAINNYFKGDDGVWKKNGIRTSGPANNYEFCRRVYLDLLGRIPKPNEIQAFVSQMGSNKNALVKKLLTEDKDNEEYARHMAHQWTVWLLTRSANEKNREQMHVWLEEKFAKNVSYKTIVTELITAKGKTNDNGAVNFILTHLGETTPRNKRKEEGHFEVVPITSRTTRMFLGLQTQCVQCHDHPFNPEWKQQAFWGVNTFFRQVDRGGNPIMRQLPNRNDVAILELKDDPSVNQDGVVYYERRNGMILPTTLTFLDGRKAEINDGKTRREVLADLVVTHENFPKAIVNRVWGTLFGRGLNEQPSVDDFGEHNKVIHEELLNTLAKSIAYNDGYNLKDLYMAICCSEVYQQSSVANSTNDKPETDVFFSRMQLRAMSPEQMLYSLWTATQGKPPDESDEIKSRRESWNRNLVKNFGDDEGNEINFNGTVVQALLMMNGKEINAEMQRKDGTIVESTKKHKNNYSQVINDIYMACLGRHQQGNESAVINKIAKQYGGKYDATFYSDVMWALLNSNEFILNH